MKFFFYILIVDSIMCADLMDSKLLQQLGIHHGKDHLKNCGYCWFRLNNQAIIWEYQTTEIEKISSENTNLKKDIQTTSAFVEKVNCEISEKNIEISQLKQELALNVGIIIRQKAELGERDMKIEQMIRKLSSYLKTVWSQKAQLRKDSEMMKRLRQELLEIQLSVERINLKSNEKDLEINTLIQEKSAILNSYDKLKLELVGSIENFQSKNSDIEELQPKITNHKSHLDPVKENLETSDIFVCKNKYWM
jgi:chromosome segregation ATPase